LGQTSEVFVRLGSCRSDDRLRKFGREAGGDDMLLSSRHRVAEIMDRPDLDPDQHRHALRGLERINRWSGSARIYWPAIAEVARANGQNVLRVLDVATGAGDVPVRLWRRARKAGVNLQIAGYDRSAVALAHARQRAEQAGAAIDFFAHDSLSGDLPSDYDLITCSLFLHHLSEEEAVGLLRRMARAARRMGLVNDRRRGLPGWLWAWAGTRLLSRSHVVHVDGPRSVAAAFTTREARALAERAGLVGATVKRRWPCRWLLTWRRPEHKESNGQ